jgi:hypothetical protein
LLTLTGAVAVATAGAETILALEVGRGNGCHKAPATAVCSLTLPLFGVVFVAVFVAAGQKQVA